MSAAKPAAWRTARPAAGPCMACSPTSATRSSRSSIGGARPIARIASSRTAAPTSSWCGCHRRPSGVFSLQTGLFCAAQRGRAVRSAGRFRSGRPTRSSRSGSTTSTHFAGCPRVAVITIMDLVTRKWICEIVSGEETSTQIQAAFCDALRARGPGRARRRTPGQHRRSSLDDAVRRPILLAVSDNGPQMTSGSTREFMAMCAIAQHFGRPGTPTDQAWIESLFSHIKADWPHLDAITRPRRPARRARGRPRRVQHGPPARRHRLRHPGRRARRPRPRRSAAHAASGSCAPAATASRTIACSTVKANRRRAADAG